MQLINSAPQIMPNQIQQLLRLESTLDELILHEVEIQSICSCSEIGKILNKNPLLPGILIMQDSQFMGMVSRRCFFEYMSRPYSLALFANRPIYKLYPFINREFLVIPSHTLIAAAAQKALQRSLEMIYEPLVVEISGHFKVLDVHQLLLASLQINTLAMKGLWEKEQALFEEKELAQLTLQSIADGVITTDTSERIKSLNPVAEKMTGWTLKEAINLPIADVFKIINENTRKLAKNPVTIALQEGKAATLEKNTLLITRNGNELAIDDSAAPIRSKDGKIVGAILVFHDVTSERCLAHQLSWQASHDSLTGLANRHEFEKRLEQTLCNARSLNQQHTLCYLDLDRFKIVNDTCGHVAGDELLRQVTTLLQTNVRSSDILARLGGDEFGLILNQCSVEQARRIANALCDRLREFRFIWQNKTFSIGVSIGLTAITGDSHSLSSILREADSACYAAKNKGRNCIHVYQPDDRETAIQQVNVQWLGRISKALEENKFCLYYQAIAPIEAIEANSYYSSSKKESGILCEHYEVLLRMIDETGEIIPPMAFIPAAERYNLMPAIDRWVISTLFAAQGKYYQENWQLCKSMKVKCDCLYTINLSGASINDEQFIHFLYEQFALYQVPPQVICFEITETVAISNITKATQFINELKEIGCRFALDDFGIGMSSFAYLKNLPVDYLKIDGSFVKDMVTDPISGAMVEAINRIGQVMGIQTIAEFVENDRTLAKLRAFGVNYAQGYGIAKPRPFLDTSSSVISEICG